MRSGCLTKLIIFIVVVAALVGVGYYLLKTGKNIDVKWTQKDYESCVKKSKVTLANAPQLNIIELAQGNFKVTGKNAVEGAFSNEEISAMLSSTNNEFGPIKDVKVRFLDDNEAEATFIVTDKVWDYASNAGINNIDIAKGKVKNLPVYVKLKVNKVSNKSVAVDIEKVSVGRLSLPNNIEKQVESAVVTMVNNIMQKYEGFSMDELRFDNNGLYFKGTLPGTVSGIK